MRTLSPHISKALSPLILLGLSFPTLAQHENDRWVFGGSPFPTNPPALNFFSGMPVPFPTVPTSPFWSTEAAAAVADETTGNLLFYTDANKVFDANNNAMPNGGASFTTNLNGCTSATQGALIIPRPDMPGHYYLFTVDCSEDFTSPSYSGLSWSEVDMSMNGGLGDVIGATRNTLLWGPPLHTKVTEKLTAARHANGTDYWIVVHEWGSNHFLSFAVTCAGIATTPVVSAVGANHNSGSSFPVEVIGGMKVSPDGTRLALVAGMGVMNVIEVFNFNTTTGVVSNPVTLPANGLDYGVEFSPNSTRLYTTRYVSTPCCGGTVYQYNLLAGNAAQINASETQLASSNSVGYGGLQLGPDNKVHIARALQTNNIGVINNPNNLGGAAGFSNTGAALSGRRCNIGLINLVRFQTDPECLTPLPVELTYFRGACDAGAAVLMWATATEHNSDHFTIERSRDGIFWEFAGEVSAQGNSISTTQYQFTDAEASFYYRLRQVDTDGAEEIFGMVAVDCPDEGLPYFDAALERIVIPAGDPSTVNVSVINGLGQIVLVSRERSIGVAHLPPGGYVVRVTGQGTEQFGRFVKG